VEGPQCASALSRKVGETAQQIARQDLHRDLPLFIGDLTSANLPFV